jgi:hypothetical protein
MPARVFVSCGQATDEERRTAALVKQWFHDNGFEPHVAIQAQSLSDVNASSSASSRRAGAW